MTEATDTTAETDAPIRQLRETYIASERMRSAFGGKMVYREPGDEMPEVHEWDWSIRDSYLRNHRIEKVTVGSTEAPRRPPGRPRKVAA